MPTLAPTRETRTPEPPAAEALSQGIAMIPKEDCFCLDCEGKIPEQNILRYFFRMASLNQRVQVVQAHCDHCNKIFQVRRMFQGGILQTLGTVEVITDRLTRQRFFRAIERAQRGSSPKA